MTQTPVHNWDCGGQRPVLALQYRLAGGGAWKDLAQHLCGVTITAPDQVRHGNARDWDGVRDIHALATEQALLDAS